MHENISDPFSFYHLRRETAFLNGTSDDIRDEKTFNVLYWRPIEEAVGYRLYKRLPSDRDYAEAIHGSGLVKRVETCAELLAIIPRGSKEWAILENAFSNAAGYRRYKEKINKGAVNKAEYHAPILGV
jgi:hypothetical protein